MPVIQKLVEGIQQFKPQPQMTPDTKVLLDTSMAETQRRAKRDEAELNLKDKELAAKIQLDMAKLQQDQQEAMEDMQLRLAIAQQVVVQVLHARGEQPQPVRSLVGRGLDVQPDGVAGGREGDGAAVQRLEAGGLNGHTL